MMIIRGRGNKAKRFEMPCAELVKRSPEDQQKQGRDLLCDLLGIKVS